MPTNNLNNRYTVSIVTDSTGGDNNPTPSGYNLEYEMIITPKPGEDIVGGDFKIDNIGSVIADSSVGYPNSTPVSTPHGLGSSYSHLDLRTNLTTFASFTSYVFEANPSFQSKNIDYIILTEEYSVADFPIAFKLKIFMLSSFLNAGPTSVQIDLDIDLVSQVIPGCTNPNALNYNPVANLDDGSCVVPIIGCMDDGTNPAFPGRPSNAVSGPASNYDPNATQQGLCTYTTLGCTDPKANNYDPTANIDDGSCTYDVFGCTDPVATNYDPNATVDDGSCILPVFGCTDPDSLNYDPSAQFDDGSCIIPCAHVTFDAYQTTDIDTDKLGFRITIDDTKNTSLFSYLGDPNFDTGVYIIIDGFNPYFVNYGLMPQYNVQQTSVAFSFLNGYVTPPNYFNTLQIDYDNGAGLIIRVKDLDLTEDFFGLDPSSTAHGPSNQFWQNNCDQTFEIAQLDYGDANGPEPIRTGIYTFTFVIDDGFGNKCFIQSRPVEFQTFNTSQNRIIQPQTEIIDNDDSNIAFNPDADPDLGTVGLPPAPPGFHYMPDGSLMSDADHQDLFGSSDTIIRRSASSDTSSDTSNTSSTSGY